MSDPANFPAPPSRRPGASGGPSLTLPRRRSAFAISEASAAARESIHALVTATRAPFGATPGPEHDRVAELERTLRQLELNLAERERIVGETELRLAERERDVAETEALLVAREKLMAAARRPGSVQAAV